MESPDEGLPVFSTSTFTKTTHSQSSGGSGDGTYGPSLAVEAGTANNGLIRITSTATLTLRYVGAGDPYQLSFIHFDAIRATTNTTGLNLTARLNGGTAATYEAFAAGSGTNQTGGGTLYDYADYSWDLSSFVMNPGDVLTIAFAADSARLDNIAVTGEMIPEPSQALLLLFSSCAFSFHRRRKAA